MPSPSMCYRYGCFSSLSSDLRLKEAASGGARCRSGSTGGKRRDLGGEKKKKKTLISISDPNEIVFQKSLLRSAISLQSGSEIQDITKIRSQAPVSFFLQVETICKTSQEPHSSCSPFLQIHLKTPTLSLRGRKF